MNKKQKIGNIFKVPFLENLNAYCRLIDNHIFTFYDVFTENELKGLDLIKLKKLFTIYIHKDVFKKSEWQLVDNLPLQDIELESSPSFFKQDVGNKKLCWIVNSNGEEKQVEPTECIGLEKLAVWDYEQVESRLRDHYYKQENKFVKHMQVKL